LFLATREANERELGSEVEGNPQVNHVSSNKYHERLIA